MKVPNKGSKDARIVVGNQPSKEYAENYDRIFGSRSEGPVIEPMPEPPAPQSSIAELKAWLKRMMTGVR
jgi:hypothetical protein